MATGDATAAAMLLAFDDVELSQLCSSNINAGSPAQSYVTPELFRTVVTGGDISGEPAEVQAALNTAKDVFDYAVNRANALKNNELRGYEIYTDAELLIQGHVCAVARYYLADHEDLQLSNESGIASNVQKKYEEATEFFEAKQGCRECSAPVGVEDTEKAGNQYDALTDFPDQVFDSEFWRGWNA